MKRWMGIILLGLAIVLALIVFARSGEAAIYIVDDNDASHQWSNYTSIQDAIDDAGAGDEIWVWNGTYTENLNINKTITLIGNSSSNTTIDAQGSGYTVQTDGDDINLTGFRITGSGSSGASVLTNGNRFRMDNCTIDNNGSYNVWIGTLDFSSIIDNCTFRNSTVGLYLSFSSATTVKSCEFRDHSQGGLLMTYSTGNIIKDNFFNGTNIRITGTSIFSYDSHTIQDCVVNGDPIYYYANVDDVTVPSDAGQVILADSDGSTIDGVSIENGTIGILIAFCDWVNVSNSTVQDQYDSIYAFGCDNLTVQNVSVTDSERYGLSLDTVTYCLINGSSFSTPLGYAGINGGSSNDNVTMNGTEISGYNYGIHLYADTTHITGGNITAGITGIYLRSSWSHVVDGCDVYDAGNGIVLENCHECTVRNSSVRGGWDDGITLQGGGNHTIIYNEIFDNLYYGIIISSGCRDNVIHHNNIADNGGTGSQGFDNEGNSTWDDDLSEGNYWDDWGGSGNYSIDGGAGAVDRYPLSDPVNTSAPEKIPEFGITVAVLTIIVTLVLVIRKRRI